MQRETLHRRSGIVKYSVSKNGQRLKRSRFSSAPLHAALRPGHAKPSHDELGSAFARVKPKSKKE
jgi:hypothetical protein